MQTVLEKCLVVLGLMWLTACGSSYKWLNPFEVGPQEQTRAPKNATLYICEGKQQFYVRMLNKNNDAWLIYPDHEVNLVRSTSNPQQYSSGAITLELNGDQTTLTDGEKIAYTGCKAQTIK